MKKVLKRKHTIWSIRPGNIEAVSCPSAFSPFPRALPVAYKALVRVPKTAPIMIPAARLRLLSHVFWKFLWFSQTEASSFLFPRYAFAYARALRFFLPLCLIRCSSFLRFCSLSPSNDYVLLNLSLMHFLYFLLPQHLPWVCRPLLVFFCFFFIYLLVCFFKGGIFFFNICKPGLLSLFQFPVSFRFSVSWRAATQASASSV